MKTCSVCGQRLYHDGGLCARCTATLRLDTLLEASSGTITVAPTYTVTEALSVLCADARCSRPRKTGSVFCADCDQRITAARLRRLRAREDELQEALADAGWYEGRLSIMADNPRGGSDMLGLLGVVAFVLAMLWALGWLAGLPVPQRMGLSALLALFLMALLAWRRPE